MGTVRAKSSVGFRPQFRAEATVPGGEETFPGDLALTYLVCAFRVFPWAHSSPYSDQTKTCGLQPCHVPAFAILATDVLVGGFFVVELELRRVPVERRLREADCDTAQQHGFRERT
jgi:hypothetical protein